MIILALTSAGALAVLATYLIHSTLLLGAAWLAARSLGHPRLRELCWKAAMVGSLVTTGLQVGIGGPLTLDLTTAPVLARAAATPGAPTSGLESGALGAQPGATGLEAAESAAPLGLELDAAARAAIAESSGEPVTAEGGGLFGLLEATNAEPLLTWQGWLLLAVALLALFSVTRLGLQALRLRRLLARAEPVEDGPLLAHGRAHRADLVLLASAELGSPLAVGARTICVPAYAHGLEPASRAALLDHELEHLRRRDGAWLLATAVLEALVPVQPLLRLAKTHLRREAELLCDEGAVARAGDGLALARCLATVAERFEPRSLPSWSAAMAGSSSELVQRVERALAEPEGSPSRGRVAVLGLASLAVVGALACAGPGVEAGAAEAEPQGLFDLDEGSGLETATAVVDDGWNKPSIEVGEGVGATVVELHVLAPGVRRIATDDGSEPTQPWTGPDDGDFTFAGRSTAYEVEGLTFSGDEIGRAALVGYLDSLDAEGSIAIAAQQGVIYADMTALLDAVIASGATDITFVGAHGYEAPGPVAPNPRNLRLRVTKGLRGDGSVVRAVGMMKGLDGAPLRPDYELPSATVEVDAAGTMSLDGVQLVEHGSSDYQALRARLTELAEEMDQEPLGPGLAQEVPGETLSIRAPASAPFERVLQVMVQCGAYDVQISKLAMDLDHDSGAGEWFVTTLPRDVGLGGDLIVEEEIELEEGEEPAPWRPRSARVDVRLEGAEWVLSLRGADEVRVEASAGDPGSRVRFLEAARTIHALHPDVPVTITSRPGTTVGQAAALLGTLTEAGMYERWRFTGPTP